MSQLRAAKQLLSKCQRCNRTQSVIWAKCPHCLYESMMSQNTILKRLMQSKSFKKITQQCDNQTNHHNNNDDDDDQYEDIIENNSNNKQLKKGSPSKNYLSVLQKKGQGVSKLVQNNVRVDNTQNQTNYQIDGSIGKYVIMVIILLLFIGVLFWDLNILRKSQLQETQRQINECQKHYQRHNCDNVLPNMELIDEWKQPCIKWQLCMEKDAYQDLKMLKLITAYFTDITNQSIETMNSKVVGIVLLIYFFGLAFSHMLGCICPRRSTKS